MVDLNLRNMNAADAIRQAVIISGRTQEDIEAAASLPTGVLDQYQSRLDPHWPNLLRIAPLSVALGTDLIIRWLYEQYLASALRHDVPVMSERELLEYIVQLSAEIGDVAAAAKAALADDDITRKEALAIRREAMEAVASLWKVINGVAGRV